MGCHHRADGEWTALDDGQLERRRWRRHERLGRHSDAQLRLRQFQWLDLRPLLQQRVDVRHADHGILVVEPQAFPHRQ